jgi:hypothetical protein
MASAFPLASAQPSLPPGHQENRKDGQAFHDALLFLRDRNFTLKLFSAIPRVSQITLGVQTVAGKSFITHLNGNAQR